MFEWSSLYSKWVYAALAFGVIALIVIARRTAMSDRLRSWWLFLPRLAVLMLLATVLLNPVQRQEHRAPDQPAQVEYLVDASRSMALEQPQSRSVVAQQAIQSADNMLPAGGKRPRVQLFRFGQQLASAADLSQLNPNDNASRLADALEQLPSRFARDLPKGVVVFSDGAIDDADRLAETVAAYRSLHVPIHVYPLGAKQVRGDVAIDELVVPARVDAGVKAPVRGVVRGTGYEGERVVLQVRSADRPELPALATLPVTLSEKPQPFELIVESHPEYGELLLEAPPLPEEVTEQNNRIPFQLSKTARKLRVLYMEGTGGNEYHWVRDALQEDKDIECVTLVADQQYVQRPRLMRVDDNVRGFPTKREELLSYDVVICSDISMGAFTKEQLDWTVELVNDRGGGFAMVGGITSFGAGGWDQSVWDQLIPCDMRGDRIGQGFVYHQFNVTIPEEASTHPIWRIVEDAMQNQRVLAAMPPFRGTNYMQRLKPAATLLAVSASPIPQAGIMPIFACQTYGRGRTFAFAPDTTADWGLFFESQWGEAGDNRYFRRFWRNVVRWLAENSTAGVKRVRFETDRVIYRAGQPIVISAQAYDEQQRETMKYQLTARLKTSGPKTPGAIDLGTALAPTSSGKGYAGEMDTQSVLATMEASPTSTTAFPPYEIEVVASYQGQELGRATSKVMILPDHHEFIQPRPRPEVLEQIANDSGGQVLNNSSELAALLLKLPSTSGEAMISRQPLWDSPLLWLVILALLTVEWILRRMSA